MELGQSFHSCSEHDEINVLSFHLLFFTDFEKGSTSRGGSGGGIHLSCEEKLATITIHRSCQDKKNKRPCVSCTFSLGKSCCPQNFIDLHDKLSVPIHTPESREEL